MDFDTYMKLSDLIDNINIINLILALFTIISYYIAFKNIIPKWIPNLLNVLNLILFSFFCSGLIILFYLN
jgi:hypothetical protein